MHLTRRTDKDLAIAGEVDELLASPAVRGPRLTYLGCRFNLPELVEKAIEEGTLMVHIGINAAARSNNGEMVDRMLDLDASPMIGLRGACKGGHFALAKKLLNRCRLRNSLKIPFLIACRHGSLPIAEMLIKEMIDTVEASPLMEIIRAAESSETEEPFRRRRWKKKNMKPEAVFRMNELDSALLQGLEIAVNREDLPLIQLLIANGARDYGAAIYHAAKNNNVSLVDLLIEKISSPLGGGVLGAVDGMNIGLIEHFLNIGGGNYSAMLYAACKAGETSLVERLLEIKGIDYSSGLVGALEGNNFALISRLLPKVTEEVQLALHMALITKNMEAIDILIEMNSVRKFLNAALVDAANSGLLSVGRRLIEKGATNLSLSFLAACEHGRIDFIEMLMENGLEASLTRGLYVACHYGQCDVVQFLLDRGAMFMPHITEVAAHSGSISMVKLILTQITDSNDLKTAISFTMKGAIERGHYHIIEALLGSDYIDLSKNINLDECLYRAYVSNRYELVAFFKEKGATIEKYGPPEPEFPHMTMTTSTPDGFAVLQSFNDEIGSLPDEEDALPDNGN